VKCKPRLIVVTGLPASGKTWLATKISQALNVPLFTKDQIKIELLESLGKKDRDWDRQVGMAAVRLQIRLAENLLTKTCPVLLESNFKEEFDARLIRDLLERTTSGCLQIVCGANGDVLIERFSQRESSAERSPLQFATNIDEWKPRLKKGFDDPMQLPGKIISVDTTDFSKVDMPAILDAASEFLSS
jgi:predicted kinase